MILSTGPNICSSSPSVINWSFWRESRYVWNNKKNKTIIIIKLKIKIPQISECTNVCITSRVWKRKYFLKVHQSTLKKIVYIWGDQLCRYFWVFLVPSLYKLDNLLKQYFCELRDPIFCALPAIAVFFLNNTKKIFPQIKTNEEKIWDLGTTERCLNFW